MSKETEINLDNRYELRTITADVVWGATDSGRPIGVLAKVFDRARKEEVTLVLSEDQLMASRGHNTGSAREKIDAALAAMDEQYKIHSENGPAALYGPLGVFKRGRGH